MTSAPVSFVGLPGAGKTTFLAALWAVCRDTADHSDFRVERFPAASGLKYLQQIADEWFEGRKVGRNSDGSWEPIELALRGPDGRELELRVPDLSGEAFRDAAAERQLETRVAALLAGSSLVVFFVNAATANTPVSLADLQPGDEPASGLEVEFEPKALETDILNAELIQMLPLLTEHPECPPPLAVVVSAWDTVDPFGLSPHEWLDTNQPMFSQVLAEYGRMASTTLMGISAQGGDYDQDPLVTSKPPSQRPLVVTANSRGSEIGAPLKWFCQLRDGP